MFLCRMGSLHFWSVDHSASPHWVNSKWTTSVRFPRLAVYELHFKLVSSPQSQTINQVPKVSSMTPSFLFSPSCCHTLIAHLFLQQFWCNYRSSYRLHTSSAITLNKPELLVTNWPRFGLAHHTSCRIIRILKDLHQHYFLKSGFLNAFEVQREFAIHGLLHWNFTMTNFLTFYTILTNGPHDSHLYSNQFITLRL